MTLVATSRSNARLAAGLTVTVFALASASSVGSQPTAWYTHALKPAAEHRSSETVLYNFQRAPQPRHPDGGLFMDASGALYGTTFGGGGYCQYAQRAGCGTVFKLTPSSSGYAESILYSFKGIDGDGPEATVVGDTTGALYGTTRFGGDGQCADYHRHGCGVVFKLTPSGSGYVETVIHNFAGNADGEQPLDALAIDSSGALYGTTNLGGDPTCAHSNGAGCGTVFKLTPSDSGYVEAVIRRFRGLDGSGPRAGLVLDAAGNLYGTTFYGGFGPCNCGVVFKLAPSGNGYAETVLYVFQGKSDGSSLTAGLYEDKQGVLYGAAEGGGSTLCYSCGTIFKLTPSGSRYIESTIYAFTSDRDGFWPTAAPIADGTGALYGTTPRGGAECSCGTVFKLVPSGSSYSKITLHAFLGGHRDGAYPSGVIVDQTGALFGTTENGGHGGCAVYGLGCGTVFRVTP